MEHVVLLTVLWGVLFFDISVLKKHNEALFREHFSGIERIFYGVAIGTVVYTAFARTSESILFFTIAVGYPVYFIRRARLLRTIDGSGTNGPDERGNMSLSMAVDALSNIFKWIVGLVVVEVLLYGIMEIFPEMKSRLGGMMVTAVWSSVLMFFLIRLSSKRYCPEGFRFLLGLQKGRVSIVRIFFIACLCGIACAFLSSVIIITRDVQPATPLSTVIETTRSSQLFLAFFGLAILFAPFFEEVVFRGYFFHVVKRYRGTGGALVVIACSFAFLHVGQYWGDWMAIAMVAFLGFVLTYLRVWSGTTIASIITHYVYNFSVTLMPILLLSVYNPPYYQYQTGYEQLSAVQKEALLQKSIERNPQFYEAYNDLAWLYARNGEKLPQALSLIEHVLEQDPTSISYRDTKAEILFRMGRVEEAAAIEKELLADNADVPYLKDQLEKFQAAVEEHGSPSKEPY